MKQQIIHDGDIDLRLVVTLIRQKLLLISILGIVGGILGFWWGKMIPSRVQVSALINPPESWEYYDKELSHAVLYNLSQQQARVGSDLGVSVIWYTMPLDTQGKVQNTVIAYVVEAQTEADGVKKLETFKSSLLESPSVQEYAQKASEKVSAAAIGAQLAISKQYELWNSLLSSTSVVIDANASKVFTEQITETVKLQQLLSMQSTGATLEWLTSPVQSSGNLSKPASFYSFLGGFMFGIVGVLIAIFPAMGISFYDATSRRKK